MQLSQEDAGPEHESMEHGGDAIEHDEHAPK